MHFPIDQHLTRMFNTHVKFIETFLLGQRKGWELTGEKYLETRFSPTKLDAILVFSTDECDAYSGISIALPTAKTSGRTTTIETAFITLTYLTLRNALHVWQYRGEFTMNVSIK